MVKNITNNDLSNIKTCCSLEGRVMEGNSNLPHLLLQHVLLTLRTRAAYTWVGLKSATGEENMAAARSICFVCIYYQALGGTWLGFGLKRYKRLIK